MRARKHRAQNRSVYDIHEDSSTELTRLSCEKTIFGGALKSKLQWRCRRGTRELDLLLTRFLAQRFDDVRSPFQMAFSELLEQQDPVIADWIWGRVPAPEGDIGEVIAMIRQDAGF